MQKPTINKDFTIRLETPNDYFQIENLIRESFWNVYRPGCSEHYVMHILRNDTNFIPELNLIMEKNGEIIGQITFMHASIICDNTANKIIPIMTFGPLSIAPKFKRQGYGKALLDYALDKAKALGCGAVCMEGNIDFYGKSGFVIASSKNIHYHAEPKENDVPYFLLKELKEHYLDNIEGTYHTPNIYYVNNSDVEEFDKKFPPKIKQKLPGQIF